MSHSASASAPAPTQTTSATVAPTSFASVVSKVMPSVVYVFVETTDTDPSGQPVVAAGSGVILRPDGYILTNRHVVDGFKRVEVTTSDWRVYQVSDKNIWMDDVIDLAVIKIDETDLPTLTFGDPASLSVGDWVVAIGHALGFSPQEGGASVTKGIVSNLDRSMSTDTSTYYDLIQTDAAINPGNSGGPLVNLAGEVVGINSIGMANAQNISFAINVATARHIFEDVIRFGRPHHPYLGINVEDVSQTAVTMCSLRCVGAVISDLEPRGPAKLSGLQPDDIIVRLGNDDVPSAALLIRALWRHEVGDRVEVVFSRDGQQMKTTITLASRPAHSGAV